MRYEARAEREARDSRTGLAAEPLVYVYSRGITNRPEVRLVRSGGGGGHDLAPATLLQPLSPPLPLALLAAQHVAADALVEQLEAVGEEVADVGQVEERERDAEQRVDDRQQATPRRLRRHVPVTCARTRGHGPNLLNILRFIVRLS